MEFRTFQIACTSLCHHRYDRDIIYCKINEQTNPWLFSYLTLHFTWLYPIIYVAFAYQNDYGITLFSVSLSIYLCVYFVSHTFPLSHLSGSHTLLSTLRICSSITLVLALVDPGQIPWLSMTCEHLVDVICETQEWNESFHLSCWKKLVWLFTCIWRFSHHVHDFTGNMKYFHGGKQYQLKMSLL